LYEMHGEAVASMLDGFFAFVILDTRDNSFYLARSACFLLPYYEDAW